MSGNRHLVNIDHQLEYRFGNVAHGRSGKGHKRPSTAITVKVRSGPTRDSCIATIGSLFDHLISAKQ